MTWAGLLVAVLYSPVGSPNLYAPVNYNTVNQGIAFTSADVQNAPSIQTSNGGGSQGLSIPSYTTTTGVGLGSMSAGASNQNSRSNMNGGGISYGFSKSNGSNGMAGGGSGLGSGFSMSGKGSGNGDNESSQAGGLLSLATNSTTSNGSMSRQGANTYLTSGSGATDPGDDPTGDPIPVGDGWIFLLILVSVYTVWKKFRA